MPEVAIAVLARAPVAGEAKTRLIPALGAEGAARLQEWLLRRALALALAADLGPVSLWCAGDPGHQAFAGCRALGPVQLRVQPDGDLGARMLAALEGSPAPGGVLLIGTDCPALEAGHLRRAAAALADHEAVLLPAEDGGYVLIGMGAPAAGAFGDVDWGSGRVLAQTRERLRALGWRWAEPATLWDVDRPADLERLAARCPELRELLHGPLRETMVAEGRAEP